MRTKTISQMLLLGTLLEASSSSSERECASEDAMSIWTSMIGCQPRETIVEVPQGSMDPSLFQVIPKFVSVQRCSGTCHQGNQYHHCIPTRTTMSMKKVMIQRLNNTGQIRSTCTEVAMEEHQGCACGCKISQSDCKPNQYFSSNLCRCECSNRDAMAQCFMSDEGRGIKVWDSEHCTCRCTETYRDCSTGYIYDQTDTCSCVPELRPASTVPVVALVVALIGTVTCLILVLISYRRTRKVLMNIQKENRFNRMISASGESGTTGNTADNLNEGQDEDDQAESDVKEPEKEELHKKKKKLVFF